MTDCDLRQDPSGQTVCYLAYGSNLHPLRLAQRVPSARALGTARLPGYRLTFSKRGRDGSGKCTLALTRIAGEAAYGAVFAMRADERHQLDAVEGLGEGYREEWLNVEVGGASCRAFTYLATASHLATDLKPYDWYAGLVFAGARHHGFPPGYLAAIAGVAQERDADEERHCRMHAFLARISHTAAPV